MVNVVMAAPSAVVVGYTYLRSMLNMISILFYIIYGVQCKL
jgi:hypothetical protein